MLSKNAILILSAAFFICFIFAINVADAQQGSIYFSAGYNKAWYSPSTIEINQGQLGNNYDLLRVKGDNKTHTPISALQLNYRLGYYCNYEQTLGLEFNFDPVNYGITDGEQVTLKGTVNSIPLVNKNVIFSAKNGYYYQFAGANLMLLNIVRRIGIYHTNNKKLSFDAILKGGVGPVMPHVKNSLPVDASDDPVLEWGGWNAGFETALRVSVYRYGYVELAGKYDYASFSSINVYEGTASQNLNIYEAVFSIGFTLPTTHYNPLFWRQNIITIIPLFVDKDDSDKAEATQDSLINANNPPLTDIPEFPEIAERDQKKRFNDSMGLVVKRYNDSMEQQFQKDFIANQLRNDSSTKAPATDSLVNKGAPVNVDSLENKMLQQANNPVPAPPAEQQQLTEKQKKKLEKQQKKDKKKLEKQQKKDQKKKEQEDKKAAEAAAADNAVKKETPPANPADSTGKQ